MTAPMTNSIALTLLLLMMVMLPRAQADLSFHGYSGLLNLPTAEVTPTGEFEAQFTNQYNALEGGSGTNPLVAGRNLMFSIGLWPHFELGGRHTVRYLATGTDAPGSWSDQFNWNEDRNTNDIAGNLKWQLPLPEGWMRLPRLAIGVEDFAGLATNFQNEYLVATQSWSDWQLSLGYRHRNYRILPRETRGLFAGLRWQPMPWLGLIGEHEPHQQSVGVKLATPAELLSWGSLGVAASRSFGGSADESVLAASLKVPMGVGDQDWIATQKMRDELLHESEAISTQPLPSSPPESLTLDEALAVVEQQLRQLGFGQLRTGSLKQQLLAVEYEDQIFDRNALDGLGVLLGVIAQDERLPFYWLKVRLKRNGIALWDVRIRLNDYRDYLNMTGCRGARCSEQPPIFDTVKVTAPDDRWYEQVEWRQSELLGRRLTDLELSPGLIYFIGTEVGEYDVAASLRATLSQPLWGGAVAALQAETPLYHSRNFEPRTFYHRFRLWSGVRELMLHQTLRFSDNIYNMTSIGRWFRDFKTVYNETMWLSESGHHRLRLNLGYFKPYLDKWDSPFGYWPGESGDLWLLAYRLALPWHNTSLELTGGQFLYQDQGIKLELMRYMGDNRMLLFFKENEYEQAAGMAFGIPLGSRRSWHNDYLKIRGSSRLDLGLQTTILDDGTNTHRPLLAIEPTMTHTLESSYFNHDRLSYDYIRANIHRMRDAYWRYGAR
ncbi:hypothetical protein D5085_05910 [Ectothiorhodospiraceae bacterium BW-2]|nr:hypothetical protein D5085_05910 [Ectothiorhodospiraceae bacterium BW-2]